jgi:hypothetical protein
MRVVTPTTASGASCVLGLQRAWAQPRRTDSSTCSATSSHTPSVGISQLECTCGKKKIGYGVGKKKGSGSRRGQRTQRSARAKDPAPCFQPFFRRGLHPLGLYCGLIVLPLLLCVSRTDYAVVLCVSRTDYASFGLCVSRTDYASSGLCVSRTDYASFGLCVSRTDYASFGLCVSRTDYAYFLVRVYTPIVQARENNPASSAVSHSFVGVCTPLFIAVTITGSYCMVDSSCHLCN